MPIIPNSSVNLTTGEALPDVHVPISKTLTVAGTAEDLALVPVGKKGRKFSLVNEGPGSAYIQIDGTATVASTEVRPGDVWYEENLAIATKLSFLGETGQTPKIRGALWAGD